MRFREYRPEDIEAMYSLDAVCFAEAFQFDRSMMREFAESETAIVVIAEAEETATLAGFLILSLEGAATHRHGYIVTIDVDPQSRRQCIGTGLMQHAERAALSAGASRVELHVAVDNRGAIQFYESQHYHQAGLAKHFYREADQDALVLVKSLL